MRVETFVARLPQGAAPQFAEDISTAFRIVTRFQTKVAEIKRDDKLTPAGKAQAIAKARDGGFSAHMAQLREGVERGLAHIASERSGLTLKKPNSDDLIGEMRRGEVRTLLRSLSTEERMRLLQSSDDREIIDAIVHAPAVLSGVPEQIHASIIKRELQELHGPRLAALDVQETAYLEVDAALKVAEMDLDNVARVEGVAA